MKIQFHGHACFSIITEDYWGNFHEIGKHLLIDPFITGNPMAQISADDLTPDVILITHGHHDHIGDTVSIAKRTGCLVICNPEIESYLHKKGVTNTHGMNIGGAYQFDFGIVKMTSALHSSALEEDGQMIYMGNPGGFLIKAEGYTIYHAGDTGLSHEMTLLGNANRIDVALLPIGGNYTMDVSDAMLAARALRAKQIVPMHYNTFPIITQNENFYSNQLLNYGIPCTVLKPEETLELA